MCGASTGNATRPPIADRGGPFVSVWGKGQVGDKTVGVMGAQEEKVYGEKQRVALGRNKLFLVDVNTMDGFPVG